MPHLLQQIELDSLEYLSLVDQGASGDADHRPAVVLIKRRPGECREPIEIKIPVVKVDAEQRLVTGWASVITGDNGEPIIDYDGDVILPADLERAVHDAATRNTGRGKGGDMHVAQGVADVVESFVVTNEKRKAFGGQLGDEGREGWIVTLKVKDEKTWQLVKSGRRPELSVKLHVRRVPISDTSALEKAMDFESVLAGLPEDQRNIILAELQRVAAPPAPVEMAAPPAAPAAPAAPAEDEAMKSLPEEIRKRLESAEKRVKDMEDAAALRDCVEKVKSDMSHVPGASVDALGSLIKSARANLSADESKLLESILTSASKALESSGLLAEAGVSGRNTDGSAEAELDAAVKAIQKNNPALKLHAAKRMALEANPELYDRLQGGRA